MLAFGMLMTMAANASHASTQGHILRLEHDWLKAAQGRDIAVLKQVLAKGYVDINYKGMLRDKADMLAAPNVHMSGFSQRVRDEKVRLFGDTAIVTGRGELMNTRNRRVIATWRYTDVYVRQRGSWRAVSSQETLVRSPRPPIRARD